VPTKPNTRRGRSRVSPVVLTTLPAPGVTDILSRDQVAAWLLVKPRQVERLGVPCLNFGVKTKRYLRADVEAWIASKRTAA